ncbi:hypothetical protein ORV05_05975 [Amycolatopsis cynarae]|uniref:Uncharacterized protein n=1 Tax=Amycolatopsis cynarae TaxID=2995223 RepID=A0ABY7B825_9PSEU|nr:hypothetical protein [Amycolatopsis sp. HUAS 11-8]WAL67333.1 hypothetical protein ORV05_05975 [Amycolatopsis sp. HUAS 11-8]
MTQPDTLDDSWKPAALREAEAQLDATMTKARELIQRTEEKLKQIPDVDHTAKPEDIAAIKAAAEKPDASAGLRALKKKVDAGELTWKDVLEGKAFQDEAVREAMTARLGEMREIAQEAEEGASLEDILEARGVTGSVFNGGGATRPQAAAPPPPPSEDDYFSGNTVLSQQQASPPSSAPPPPPVPPKPPTPGKPATPPAPPRAARPPARREEPGPEDYFEDPLSAGRRPKPSDPPPRSSRPPRRDDGPDDDDYFGGPLLR